MQSIVTSCLSHIDMQHLACNMFLLAVLCKPPIRLQHIGIENVAAKAPMAFRVLTNSQYLSVYVGSGIAGNLAALINNTRYIDPTLGNQPFLFVGASGAVLGIMAFSAAVLAKRLSPMVGSALLPWSLLAAQLISEGYKARTMPVISKAFETSALLNQCVARRKLGSAMPLTLAVHSLEPSHSSYCNHEGYCIGI